jgi:hypothetical protein
LKNKEDSARSSQLTGGEGFTYEDLIAAYFLAALPAVFGRGKDPDCAEWPAWRGQHHRTVPLGHESIDNLTPADVYFGRAPTILAERERIKRQTIAHRCLQHRSQAARGHHTDGPKPPLI